MGSSRGTATPSSRRCAARTFGKAARARRGRAGTSLVTIASPLRIFSYIVARDFGFAPNPFHGWCTLATCKPEIRRRASVGDWVIGTGSAQQVRTGYAVYAMRIEETLSFDQYWVDPRFVRKRPDLAGSRKLAFGDNIYGRDSQGGWLQSDSHHSLHDGSANALNVVADTRIDRVLLSENFIYWGGDGPAIPDDLRAFGPDGEDVCCPGRGDRCRFSPELVGATVAWLNGINDRGLQGRPGRWP